MFPYKVQLVQELKLMDRQVRQNYCFHIQEKSRIDHFHLNGFVNRQNTRFCGTENHRVNFQREFHPLNVTVLCGITSKRVLVPYFFEDNNGNVVTINALRYRQMSRNFMFPVVKTHLKCSGSNICQEIRMINRVTL